MAKAKRGTRQKKSMEMKSITRGGGGRGGGGGGGRRRRGGGGPVRGGANGFPKTF